MACSTESFRSLQHVSAVWTVWEELGLCHLAVLQMFLLWLRDEMDTGALATVPDSSLV